MVPHAPKHTRPGEPSSTLGKRHTLPSARRNSLSDRRGIPRGQTDVVSLSIGSRRQVQTRNGPGSNGKKRKVGSVGPRVASSGTTRDARASRRGAPRNEKQEEGKEKERVDPEVARAGEKADLSENGRSVVAQARKH